MGKSVRLALLLVAVVVGWVFGYSHIAWFLVGMSIGGDAIFGNDEDGPYGPPYEGRATFYPATRWGAVRWWFRNPCHNLFFHVLNWPGGPIWRFGKVPGWNGYLGFRKPGGAIGFAWRKETKIT